MKIIKHISGYSIKTCVIFHDDIKRYSSGFVIIHPNGNETQRIAITPDLQITEQAAEQVSKDDGKIILQKHLNNAYLDFHNEN